MKRRISLALIVSLVLQPLLNVGVASAQDRPVVFVHGLASSGATWEGAANRLSGSLAIQPFRPDLVWWGSYESQANQVQDQLWWLGADTVAVGHSNGGLVSRQWSRMHPLSGIVTVGTPHGGAPLIQNLPYFVGFVSYLESAINDLCVRLYGACCTWRTLVEYALEFALQSGLITSSATFSTALNVLGGSPFVFTEMAPASPFQYDINSGGNIAREQAEVPSRVGIVSIANNFWWGGPIRAAFPENADTLALYRDITMLSLNGAAFTIMAFTDPSDWYWWDIAHAMQLIAGILVSMDYWWCQSVSEAPALGRYGCAANDTVVPDWSQDYSPTGAIPIGMIGPTHTQETSQSDGYIALALTAFMGVAAREATAPPLPPAGGPVTMGPDTYLFPGQWALSEDQRFGVSYQDNGDLVLAKWDGEPIWLMMLPDYLGFAVMQGDGNFVVYDGDGQPLWATGTEGHPGAYLSVQNDGNMVIYDVNGAALWATGTNWY